MSATSKAQVAVTVPTANVRVHPKNPRRKATADDAMVASIKEAGIGTPLLVAVDLQKNTPAEVLAADSGSTVYVVAVDGHRRLAGAKKARRKDVPVVIDLALDTELKQLQAMLLASEHREDLSPIERAEGYQQLHLDFKVKQGDIAKTFGRTPKEISNSLKLLKLTKSTQGKVHDGQISIDDAEGLLEFAGDTAATKRLEKAATSGSDFRYRLSLERRARKQTEETAAAAAELEARGVTQLAADDPRSASAAYLHATGLRDEGEHDGCLAYRLNPGQVDYGTGEILSYLCLDPDKHQGQVPQAEIDRQVARGKALKEREAAAAAAAAARDVRLTVLADEIGRDLKASPALEQLLRATLPALVRLLEDQYDAELVYQQLVVAEEARWAQSSVPTKAARAAHRDHLADLPTLSKASLAKHLAAALLALGDQAFIDDWDYGSPEMTAEMTAHGRLTAAPYAALLAERAYGFGGPDADLLARLMPAIEPAAADDPAGEGAA